MRSGLGRVAIAAGAIALLVVSHAAAAASKRQESQEPLTLDAVNAAAMPSERGSARSAGVLKAEVLLDRAGFSPGVIDGRRGENFKKALAAFQEQHRLRPSGALDRDTWARLTATSDKPVLVRYAIRDEDVKGPFTPMIPRRLEDMARLERLAYTGPLQLLAEKFHMQQDLLKTLNPGARFEEAGAEIVVADVAREAPGRKAGKVVVDKKKRDLRVLARDGALLAFYPASVGSRQRPAPSGALKVHAVAVHPKYHYDPKLRFKEVRARRPFTIAAGPNNPVGAVWIDLTDSYGIHGTADPERIGKSFSHGCVRLTNWDALALAGMVQKGTEVDFVD